MRNRLVLAAATASAVAIAGVTAAAAPSTRARGDVRVFAAIPSPGYPAFSLVAPDGTVYVSTFTGVGGGTPGPSKVFAYSSAGHLIRTYTVHGQTPGTDHAVQVATRDRQDNLYLLDQKPARVVVLNPRSGGQRTYATFADVPTCQSAGRPDNCSNTVTDNMPEPDYAAWLPDGSLVVTDYAQQLLWRVPPHGGRARVWMNDLRLDGEQFGPAGIVTTPGGHSLLLTVSAGGVLTSGTTDNAATGKLYRIDVDRADHPARLTQLWASAPAEAPDGFALSRSGHVYVALSGPSGNAVAELAPDSFGQWHEIWRVPGDPVAGESQPVPWDTPTSVQFLGQRLLVTNQAYFSGDASHWAVFDVQAGEGGARSYIPVH
jgi:sugar lactone lactonase YvrE